MNDSIEMDIHYPVADSGHVPDYLSKREFPVGDYLSCFPSDILQEQPKILWIDPRWRHQMETFSMLLAICAGNSPVTGQFPAQRPVTRSFDVFFDLRLNKRLSKQWSGWWFETRSRPLWRHCNAMRLLYFACILLRIFSSIMFWCSEHNVIL